MVLFGPDLVALFSNSGPRETTTISATLVSTYGFL
jgi:hypothetical protein